MRWGRQEYIDTKAGFMRVGSIYFAIRAFADLQIATELSTRQMCRFKELLSGKS